MKVRARHAGPRRAVRRTGACTTTDVREHDRADSTRATARIAPMRRSSARCSDRMRTISLARPLEGSVTVRRASVTKRGRPRSSQRLGILRWDRSVTVTRQPAGPTSASAI